MSIESLASRVIANEEIRITVEALDDWLVGLLQSIAEAERLGPDESVAKIKKGLSLRTASDELRDITVVVQVTQKPYKVQPAASRPIKVGDRNRGAWNNGHGPEYTDGDHALAQYPPEHTDSQRQHGYSDRERNGD